MLNRARKECLCTTLYIERGKPLAGQSGNQDIARRYATAFFALAAESNQIDFIAKDLDTVEAILNSGGDIDNFLNNATLRREDQMRALADIAKAYKLSDLTAKFLGTVALKRRLPALRAIVYAVKSLIADSRNEITADVTAAQALDQEQIREIEVSLQKILGKTVKVNLSVDPSITGGLIIKVGSRLIDSSVKTNLERLHRALKNTNELSDKAKMKEVA